MKRVNVDEEYWVIKPTMVGSLIELKVDSFYEEYHYIDDSYFKSGNYFNSIEEAKSYIEHITAVPIMSSSGSVCCLMLSSL